MLIAFSLGSLVGVTLCNSLKLIPNTPIWPLALITFFGILFVNWCSNKQWIRFISGCLLGGILGFSWVTVKVQGILSWHLPWEDINQPIVIEGIVTNTISKSTQLRQVDVMLTTYQEQPLKNTQPIIRLYWSNPKVDLHIGDKITCLVQLKPPWNFSNPGGIDSEKQFFIQNIRAIGRIVSLNQVVLHHSSNLTQIRVQLYEKINQLIPRHQFKGVMIATSLGFNNSIPSEQWQVFQQSGTVHAIAISGLHITLVSGLCAFIVTFIARRFYVVTLWTSAQNLGALFGLLAATVYSAISGFGIPTQRAFIMVLVGFVALYKHQFFCIWSSMAMAWLVVALLSPLATLQIGFWLSFGCVFVLIYGRGHYGVTPLQKWIMPQLVVFGALIPLCAYFFRQIPILSILANLITLPIMNWIVVPLSLLGLLFTFFSEKLAIISFDIANFSMQIVWWLLVKIVRFPGSVIHTAQVSGSELFLGLFGVLWLLLPKPIPGRMLGYFALLPLFYAKPLQIAPGDFQFILFDVGQGLAAMIHTQHHHLLFDAGPQYGESNAGKDILMPYLQQNHIQILDKVIISHGDLDHRAGLQALSLPIVDLISSEPDRVKAARTCIAGETWQWDGVEFEILNGASELEKNHNNASCVLKVSNQRHSVLLTGDIEHKAEKKMLIRYGDKLKSSILVVPHHGSKTSSIPSFIQAVSPTYALFSVGFANRFGFPKEVIWQRYGDFNFKRLLSYETGALIFHLKATQELTPPIRWRETDYHYWNYHAYSGGKGD